MKKFKVVINTCYGGFVLTDGAWEWMISRGLDRKYYRVNPNYNPHEPYDIKYFIGEEYIPRHHHLLVKCVEELGARAGSLGSELCVVEIDTEYYQIDEVDGNESIRTLDTSDWIRIDVMDKKQYGKEI